MGFNSAFKGLMLLVILPSTSYVAACENQYTEWVKNVLCYKSLMFTVITLH